MTWSSLGALFNGRALFVLIAMLLVFKFSRKEEPHDSCGELPQLRETRDTLSRMLNNMSQRAAIQSCESKVGTPNVSERGGYCEKQEDVSTNAYGHVLDEGLAHAISKLLAGKTVASFGDGSGGYKAIMDERKEVAVYDAYDGGPFYDVLSGGKVKYLDLTIPQYGLPAYDWVVSVEVAEHIAPEFEFIYLDNILRHAKEGIIISYAMPNFPGFNHVNTKYLHHLTFYIDKLGFTCNEEASTKLRQALSHPDLKYDNLAVYERFSPIDIMEL